jgi:vacuolar protein sorting-associated protein 35
MTMLQAIVSSGGSPPKNVKELEELFTIIAPVFREEHAVPPKEHTAREVDLLKGLGVISATESFGPIAEDAPVGPERTREILEECNLVSKMVHMLDHEDTDVAFEMLSIARNHLSMGGKSRVGYTLVPVVFLALRLVDRIYVEEYAPRKQQGEEKTEDTVTSQPAVGESKGETQKDKTKEEGEHPGMKDEGNSKSAHDDGEAQEETDSAAEKKVTTEAPQAETVTDDRGQAEADVDLDRKECAAVDTPASDEKQHEPQKENGADLSWKKTVR